MSICSWYLIKRTLPVRRKSVQRLHHWGLSVWAMSTFSPRRFAVFKWYENVRVCVCVCARARQPFGDSEPTGPKWIPCQSVTRGHYDACLFTRYRTRVCRRLTNTQRSWSQWLHCQKKAHWRHDVHAWSVAPARNTLTWLLRLIS